MCEDFDDFGSSNLIFCCSVCLFGAPFIVNVYCASYCALAHLSWRVREALPNINEDQLASLAPPESNYRLV